MNSKPNKNQQRLQTVQAIKTVIREKRTIDSVFSETRFLNPKWSFSIVQGVLRWFGFYEHLIEKHSKTKPPKFEIKVAMMTALEQALHFDSIEKQKVCNETVELIKSRKGASVSGYANAILREIFNDLETSSLKKRSEIQSTLPKWIQEELKNTYELSKIDEILTWSLERPQVFARLKPGQKLVEPDQYEALTDSGMFRVVSDSIEDLKDLKEARVYIQDYTNQNLVDKVDEYLRSQEIEPTQCRVLDLCSAPGGKSIGLSWKGYQLVATDFSSNRMKRLKSNLQTYAPEVECIDWKDRAQKTDFDVVWVDAPCTSLGTIQRNPESKWIKGPEELKSLIEIQKDLIEQARALIRPGGFLIYSVCSILPSECFEHADDWSVKWQFLPSPHKIGDGFLAGIIQKTAE